MKTKKDLNVKSEMRKLDRAILVCTLCRLSNSRVNAVPGDGRIESIDVIFVGEAPGKNEDLIGKPFVGASGNLLDELLKKAGLKREGVYITNIVKCRPPNNRKPLSDEIEICTKNYLERQIEILRPVLICALGTTALEYFTGKTKIAWARGKLLKTKDGLAVLPTFHPAAVFRNPLHRAFLQKDLRKIPSIVSELKRSKNRNHASND